MNGLLTQDGTPNPFSQEGQRSGKFLDPPCFILPQSILFIIRTWFIIDNHHDCSVYKNLHKERETAQQVHYNNSNIGRRILSWKQGSVAGEFWETKILRTTRLSIYIYIVSTAFILFSFSYGMRRLVEWVVLGIRFFSFHQLASAYRTRRILSTSPAVDDTTAQTDPIMGTTCPCRCSLRNLRSSAMHIPPL